MQVWSLVALAILSTSAVSGEYDESFKCTACTNIANYIIPVIREAGTDTVDNVCTSFESDTLRSGCGQIVGTGWNMIVNWVKYRKAGPRDICVSLSFCENGGRDLDPDNKGHGADEDGTSGGRGGFGGDATTGGHGGTDDDSNVGNGGFNGGSSGRRGSFGEGSSGRRGSVDDAAGNGRGGSHNGNGDMTSDTWGGASGGRRGSAGGRGGGSEDNVPVDDDERARLAEREREAEEGRKRREAVQRFRRHLAERRQ